MEACLGESGSWAQRDAELPSEGEVALEEGAVCQEVVSWELDLEVCGCAGVRVLLVEDQISPDGVF